MAEKKEYLWRPNDNSVKTNLRYDLEANHWIDSIKHNTVSPTPTFSQVSGVIGLLLSFTFNLIHFTVLIIIDVVKWVRTKLPKKPDPLLGVPHFDNRAELTDEECMALIKKSRESGVVVEIDLS